MVGLCAGVTNMACADRHDLGSVPISSFAAAADTTMCTPWANELADPQADRQPLRTTPRTPDITASSTERVLGQKVAGLDKQVRALSAC